MSGSGYGKKGDFLSLTRSEHLEKRIYRKCNSLFDPQYYLEKFQGTLRYTCLAEWVSRFTGGKAVPLFTSQTSPAKMSVTLPSANLEDYSQSLSIGTGQGDTDSSGADTFWMRSESQYNTCAGGFEVIFLWHETISQAILVLQHIQKNNLKFFIEVDSITWVI